MTTIRWRAFCGALVFLALPVAISAQKSKALAPAPIPGQVAAAHTIFVANAGGNSFEAVVDQTVFSGGPDRPYNQFYAAVHDSGRYQLVSSPANADLVFEIGWVLSDTGLKLPVLGELRLTLIDPKTHVTLWRLSEYVRGAILQGNRDKNFDQAMSTILSRLKQLTGTPPATTSPN